MLLPYDCFHYVNEFAVHDLYTCSHHAPVHLNVFINSITTESIRQNGIFDKTYWNKDNAVNNRSLIEANVPSFNSIVDNIVDNSIDRNNGIDQCANILCSSAFRIFGRSVKLSGSHNSKRYKNPWFYNNNLASTHPQQFCKEIRKFRKENDKSNNITSENLLNHFKQIFSDEANFRKRFCGTRTQ